ncbi:hypothetical protein [Priestia sp. YIM B13448]|uniref:hypothetical protein n=1 Tax=Priestia sp. YIM B13448 TaxID=3366308 RepID=UPI00366DA7FF
MSKHLLLENIHIYTKNYNRKLGTDGSIYSLERGYWINNNTSLPLVNDPNRPLPSTKKHDVERGEDLK